MHALLTTALLASSALASSNHNHVSRSRHHQVAARGEACARSGTASPANTGSMYSSASKVYTVEDWFQGEDFFNEWNFWDQADPTNGLVDYQNKDNAQSKGLAYVDQSKNQTVLQVDSWSQVAAGGHRASVRISSQKTYNSGLFILDAEQMPVGCGTWPSWWTVGSNWPYQGEIDIIEGVNSQGPNQMTLHSGTNKSCTITKPSNTTENFVEFTGSPLQLNCYSTQGADAGCGIKDTATTSFGPGFNAAQGGVYAMLWDTEKGVSMWNFPRDQIPQDITDAKPQPATWGVAAGYWPASSCDIADNFVDHVMVIDTTICGNWAAGAYGASGCPGTCQQSVANASNFVDAKWVINYLAVYQ